MADHDDDDDVKLALLAHDLRTPLAAMRLTAELIGSGALNEAQSEQLSILIRSIDALTQITGELVRAADPKTTAGGGQDRVAEIVRETADLFKIAAEAKGLFLDVSMDEAALGLDTRHGATMRRVLTTLLDNAVKYTPSGGVSVALEILDPDHLEKEQVQSGPWFRLCVTDTGPGIDPEERERLFRPFVRGRHGREGEAGTGLGLWGVAQFVRELGGRLRLGRAETGGSRFEVHLPASGEGEDGSADRPRSDRPVSPVVSPGLPAHVLIVDDNDTNCRLLSALLESFGISADVANSGEQAVELVRNASYDAALLDLHMPGMSGIETAEEMRKLKAEDELPLIAVTAALESVGDIRLRDAGFRDILTKPLSPAALHEVLERVCQRRPGAL